MRTPSCVVGLLARKSYFEWCYGSRGRPEISVVVCACVVGATVFPPAFSSSLHPTLYLSDERGHLICVSSIELCAGENSPLTSQPLHWGVVTIHSVGRKWCLRSLWTTSIQLSHSQAENMSVLLHNKCSSFSANLDAYTFNVSASGMECGFLQQLDVKSLHKKLRVWIYTHPPTVCRWYEVIQ